MNLHPIPVQLLIVSGPFGGLLLGLAAVLLMPTAAAAIVEYPVPPGSNPGGITAGPDGALWFVAEGSSTIYRMTTAGVLDPPAGFPVTITGSDSSLNTLDQITVGPDGALWFTQPRDNEIGRITTAGAVSEYTLPDPLDQPEGITSGPDGALWFSATGIGKIGRITTTGVFDPAGGFPATGIAGAGISDITAASDGALWFTESATASNSIGRITTGGVITHYPVPTAASDPSGITEVPGAGLWFTEFTANQIGAITLGGVIAEFPGAGVGPSSIAAGRDGALWFTESGTNAVGRITTAGAITNHFPVPTPASDPSDVTTGPDGALWFTEFLGDKIGRIETAPPPPPPQPVVLPTPVPKRVCKVPKVKGLRLRKAKKKLKRAGCKYRVRGRGFVVSTRPKAGKRTTKKVLVRAKPKKRSGRRRSARTAGADVTQWPALPRWATIPLGVQVRPTRSAPSQSCPRVAGCRSRAGLRAR
jgi:virginiamycin B lyase